MIIRRRLSVADMLRMEQAGVFAPDERLELIDGELNSLRPIGPRHAHIVNILVHILSRKCGEGWFVSAQNPICLGPNDLPQPDVAIIRTRDWSGQHPGVADAALVVEVADSSREFDLGEKRLYYATRSVAELWIVDLVKNRLEVSIGPGFRGYGRTSVLVAGGTAVCQAIPEISVPVASLFPGATP